MVNMISNGQQWKQQNILNHRKIPSLTKEGTEGWLIRDEALPTLLTKFCLKRHLWHIMENLMLLGIRHSSLTIRHFVFWDRLNFLLTTNRQFRKMRLEL